MKIRLVAILMIVHLKLFAQEKIIVTLPHPVKNVEGTEFLHDTLSKYTGYRFCVPSFPGISRLINLHAGRYSLEEILRKAFPGVRLPHTKSLINKQWCVIIAPETLPKENTPIKHSGTPADVNAMPADTIVPTYPNGFQQIPILSTTSSFSAASSAIWGSFSSNAVIVVNTIEGHRKQKPLFTVTVNMISTEKPKLDYLPKISTDSFISAETQFFNNGYYDSYFKDPYYALTPAVEILRKWKDKALSDADAHTQLSRLASHNLLSDLGKFFYRSSVDKDYHISVSGGGDDYMYYLGAGLTQDNTMLQYNGNDRRTLNGRFTAFPFSSKLEASVSFNVTGINQGLNNPGSVPTAVPYISLADVSGNALPINYKYNSNYIDTNSMLLDRHFLPLKELRMADNKYFHTNVYGQLNLTWHIRPDLSIAVIYRQDRGQSTQKNTYDSTSFYVHDMIDQSAQIQGNKVLYGISPGYMRFTNDTFYAANNVRAQMTYTSKPRKHRQLVAMSGMELSDWTTFGQITQEYGLGGPNASSQITPYASYSFSTSRPSSINSPVPGLTNRYISIFSNASYTWKEKFSIYGSLRSDASNNEGVAASHRWSPFWAVGLSQQFIKKPDTLSGEPGHLFKWRASYGWNGNISNQTAALATQPLADNIYGFPQTGIASAPDPGRRWERNAILNFGVDLHLLQDKQYPQGRLSISLDVYSKKVTRLIGDAHLPLSSGVTDLWSNSAGIRGNGLDLAVSSVNKWGKIGFQSNLLLSVARDWVSQSLAGPQLPQTYIQGYPMVGKPVTALYSYKYAGLDNTGDPMGFIRNQDQLQPSKNYVQLQNDPGTVVICSGASQPQLFGHWLNTISYHGFSFSAGVTFKAAFVIRRPTVNYGDMANGLSAGETDYYRRWMKPGDERITNIPALPAVNLLGRDAFFASSEATIIRGDFIRLQDCRFSYQFTQNLIGHLGLKQAEFYFYANNLGIIWRANKYGIDPDATFTGGLPAPRSWSVGTKISF